jgi:hypothetical protein
MIQVCISENEILYLRKLAKNMNTIKRQNNIELKKLGNPNIPIDDWQTLGLVGEMAFGKLIQQPINDHVTVQGDAGYDFFFRGQKIAVRTSFYPNGRILLTELNELKNVDIVVLVVCSEYNKFNLMNVIGYISKKNFLRKYTEEDLGYGNRLVIDRRCLVPIKKENFSFAFVKRPENQIILTDVLVNESERSDKNE